MKEVTYQPFSGFVYRIPRFPYDKIFDLLTTDNIEFLKTEMLDTDVKGAIRIASPILSEEIEKYLSGKITKEKDIIRIQNSFIKYFSRMCTRCTPFGLFAASGAGTVNRSSQDNFDLKGLFKVQSRFDMYFLCSLYNILISKDEIRSVLRYKPNTSLYQMGSSLRYIEYYNRHVRRIHRITSVKTNEYLLKILEFATNGKSFEELVDFIVSLGFDKDEAQNYVNQLISAQILMSDLEPVLKENSMTQKMLCVLSQHHFEDESVNQIKEFLNKFANQLNSIWNSEFQERTDFFRAMEVHAKAIIPGLTSNVMLQTDMFRENDSLNIGKDSLKNISNILHFSFKYAKNEENSVLKSFKQSFEAKYESQEVPLMRALDPEIGIGYPINTRSAASDTPILDVLKNKEEEKQQRPDARVDLFLFRKYCQMLKDEQFEIEITDEDLKNVPDHSIMLPETLSVIFRYVGPRDIYLIGVSNNASRLISRFGYGDPLINQTLYEIGDYERKAAQKHNSIDAEVFHLPGTRVGNILERPCFREYEINILTSPADSSHSIPVSDLMVSVKNNKVILRSKSLNKIVRPHISTAHAFTSDTQPVYQFLGDVQYQNETMISGIPWKGLSKLTNHIPRIRYKNIILSREAWIIKKEQISSFIGSDDMIAQLSVWREKQGIPEIAILGEGDNELVVDFRSKLSVNAFFSTIKNTGEFYLYESVFDKNDMVFHNGTQSYTNECILPLYLKNND